jgi:hypothetical protein
MVNCKTSSEEIDKQTSQQLDYCNTQFASSDVLNSSRRGGLNIFIHAYVIAHHLFSLPFHEIPICDCTFTHCFSKNQPNKLDIGIVLFVTSERRHEPLPS